MLGLYKYLFAIIIVFSGAYVNAQSQLGQPGGRTHLQQPGFLKDVQPSSYTKFLP
jgi:hypothetical protein